MLSEVNVLPAVGERSARKRLLFVARSGARASPPRILKTPLADLHGQIGRPGSRAVTGVWEYFKDISRLYY